MEKMSRWILMGILICLAGSSWAQNTNSPSLEVTLKFIADTMNAQGKINYASFIHDSSDNSDWTNSFSLLITNAVSYSTSCLINYHHHEELNNQVANDLDTGIPFRSVAKIQVMTVAQLLTKANAAAGNPAWIVTQINPELFVVKAVRKTGGGNQIFLEDQDTANRLAKAMLHAVELCGGGDDAPF